MDRSMYAGEPYKPRRMPGHEYSQPGSYFVTTNVKGWAEVFGSVVNGEMRLNILGNVVVQCLLDLPKHYPHCVLDSFVVMPNHVHVIVRIVEVGINPKHGLSEIIRAWKTFSSKQINALYPSISFRWQRSFRDNILPDAFALNKVRAYIANNPAKWSLNHAEEDDGIILV